jgi:hypothetical protein
LTPTSPGGWRSCLAGRGGSVAARWEKGFARLLECVEATGDAHVQAGYKTADRYPLGASVATQRNAWDRGKLSAEQIARLEALPGWTWDAFDTKFENGYAHMREYVDSHGEIPRGRSKAADGYPLGNWRSNQLIACSKGKLSAIASPGSRRCPAGRGAHPPTTGGRRVSTRCWRVMLARCPAPRSTGGSSSSATAAARAS